MRTLLLLLLMAAGCDSPTDTDGWERRGYIATEEDTTEISLPDTIVAGEPFRVTVRTWGVSNCVRKGSARVTMDGLVAVIAPLDRHAPAGSGCHRMWKSFQHEVDVTFPSDLSGQGMVIIRGELHTPAAPDLVEARAVTVRSRT